MAILIDTQTTDANGQVTFANLPVGNYYYVLRTPPAGYNTDVTPTHAITVTNTTPIVETNTDVPTNTATLTVKKHLLNNEDYVLPGAKFTLLKGTQTLVAESAASGADGLITFDNLMTMATPVRYTVQETTHATGNYELNPDPYNADLDLAGTTLPVPDTFLGDIGSAQITLQDSFYSGAKLDGGVYDLYWEP